MDVTFVVGAVALGLIPASIASRKGRSFTEWWLFGALLFIVAMPMSLLIPDVPRASSRVLQVIENHPGLTQFEIAPRAGLTPRVTMLALSQLLRDRQVLADATGREVKVGRHKAPEVRFSLRSNARPLGDTVGPSSHDQNPTEPRASVRRRLEELNELQSHGLVDESEYAARRKAILDDL